MHRSLALVFLAAACGGDPEEIPVCTQPGSVAFEGTLDGASVSDRLTARALVVEDVTGPTHELTISFSETGLARIELEIFDDPIDDAIHEARGYIDLSETGGLVAGNCNIDGFYSTVRWDEDMQGGTFTLRGLREQPFCDGPQFDGVINGCFRMPE